MNYTNFKKEITLWLIILAPFLYLAWAWNSLPERVPIHFDINNNINGWGRKISELILPILNLAAYLLTLFLPLIDPKKKNYEFFQGTYFKIRLVLALFLSAINILVIYVGVTGQTSGGRLLPALTFLLIAVLGNFLINIKPTWFVGIRTPWTLSSDTVWKKTHLVGGRLFFYGGLLCFILTLLIGSAWFRHLLLLYIFGSVLFLYGYSYWLYKQEQDKQSRNV
jgi:uncharacterized membrane protein